VTRPWVIAAIGFVVVGLAVIGLALFVSARITDAHLAQQRRQAADALDRWAAVAASADGGEIKVVPPAWDPYNPPAGLTIDAVEVGADERDLVAIFVGSPDPAYEPCGIDYTGEAVESDLAVVVVIVEHRPFRPGGCASVGAVRRTLVRLATPLGDRTVLDVQQGLPVDVQRPSQEAMGSTGHIVTLSRERLVDATISAGLA
jgi:hypothetical protein